MRLRNVKNKEFIMDSSPFLIRDPENYKGKWCDYFSNQHPIYIEIGMGKGKFIIENALKHPDINYIGIEKYDSVIAKALLKVASPLPNLCMIRGDASDPWPKNRHHNRRLSSKIFLEKYDSIFRDRKEIEMRTDNRDLFAFSLVSFSQYGYQLDEVSLDLHQDNLPDITTEYEDRFSSSNCPIYYVKCSKL